VADDDLSHDLPESAQHEEDPPDQLRVHTLARALGTTSKRVLDALNELDGRARSAQSAVDEVDAERVREALSSSEAEETGDTGESTVETTVEVTVSQADYMPLFVAPQRTGPDTAESDEDLDEGFDEGESDEEPSERPASRRRRRGRRGRGRGRGEQSGNDADDMTDAASAEAEAADGQPEDTDEGDDESAEESSEGASRRRRRRRRRKAGDTDANGAPDDPPNTVVHERAPRTPGTDKDNGEIQGITGSTRLEAKRQRRRDGRDAGRRRPPILSVA
jgi:ribonuclease E